jgi:hypothetical protein
MCRKRERRAFIGVQHPHIGADLGEVLRELWGRNQFFNIEELLSSFDNTTTFCHDNIGEKLEIEDCEALGEAIVQGLNTTGLKV